MAKQTKDSSRVVTIAPVLFAAIVGLCISVFEASWVVGRQVGVDARKPNKNSANNSTSKSRGAGKTNRKPAPPKQRIPMGSLILRADMPCRITIDGEYLSELGEGQSKKLKVRPGQHTVGATSLSGLYRWAEPVQVGAFKTLTVSIALKTKKAEAEEVARIEGQRKSEEAKEAVILKERARLEEERKNADAAEDARRKKDVADRANRDGYVMIPSGDFMMGSKQGEDDEKPVHRVEIIHGFEIGRYEVTQGQWESVMGTNPSSFKGRGLPVENVSWHSAQSFVAKLNARSDGYVYRLPTEAEWEYACRAGGTGDYPGDLNTLATFVWFGNNSGEQRLDAAKIWKNSGPQGYVTKLMENKCQSHPVGQKLPNDWGLYDMLGNVWEWCLDRYESRYYSYSPTKDPQGPYSSDLQGPYSSGPRVIRGGGFLNSATVSRVSARAYSLPDRSNRDVGLRLVRKLR